MRKTKDAKGYLEAIRKLHRVGVNNASFYPIIEQDNLFINKLLGFFKKTNTADYKMLFFIMYDIENNKVRNLVAKYLEKKGCIRIQKSIFLANTDFSVYQEICIDLAEVQACYDNQDSIIAVPIPIDYLSSMKVIGKYIDTDIIIGTKNTLFF